MLNIIAFEFGFTDVSGKSVKCNISVYDECFIRIEYAGKYAYYVQVVTNKDARAEWALYDDHIEYTGTAQELINAMYTQYRTGYRCLLRAIVQAYIEFNPDSHYNKHKGLLETELERIGL